MARVVITAGHSNSDPGAVNHPVTEAHIVTDFRNLVAFYLNRAGVDFVTDGAGNENRSLSSAISLINRGDIAVEFHCNASSNRAATGVETLSAEKDKPLGAKLCQAVSDVMGIRNRGAKNEGSGQHSRLGFVRAGGIILELFFLSNDNDLQAYLDVKWVVARAVADVLIEAAKGK